MLSPETPGKATLSMSILLPHVLLVRSCRLDLIHPSRDSAHGKALPSFCPTFLSSCLTKSVPGWMTTLFFLSTSGPGLRGKDGGPENPNTWKFSDSRPRFQCLYSYLSSCMVLGRRPELYDSHSSNLQNGLVCLPLRVVRRG